MSDLLGSQHGADLLMQRSAFLSQAYEERDEETLQDFVHWLLSRCNSALDGVPNEFVASLLRTATLLVIERGQAVYKENDKNCRAFVVLSGCLSAYTTAKTKIGLGEHRGVKAIQSSPLLVRRGIQKGNWNSLMSLYTPITASDNICSVVPFGSLSHLPRSSSEPLGLNKSNLMSSSSTTFGGRDDWQGCSKGLGLRLRKRSSRPSSPSCPVSVSCLADKHANVDKTLGSFLGHIVEGQLFGEMAFFNPKVPRDMTVLANETMVRLMVIEGSDFYMAARKFKREDLHEKTSFLETIDIFKDWDWSLKFHLAHSLEKERSSLDRYLVREGDPAAYIYFIESGQAVLEMQTEVQSSLPDLPSKKLQKSRRSTVKELARLQPKSVFGLEEMLDELKTYRRSLRACEQVTMLRIPMQRLRSAIEKYHPETLGYIGLMVKQHEDFHNARIDSIDNVSGMRKGSRGVANVSEKKEYGRYFPKFAQSVGRDMPSSPFVSSQRSLFSNTSRSKPNSPLVGRRRPPELAIENVLGDGALSSRSLPNIVDYMKQTEKRATFSYSPVATRKLFDKFARSFDHDPRDLPSPDGRLRLH
ncbi:uncharacterized protein LOC134178916 isoform X2 [Corticium candelabrum]|uniref:uncharacterized protein LOC134178916 isoform X2 n=1 Tax=Corticium candelabrum TaxID=121492 RepID=UPI002E2522E4|nr:uncharacterized protein LOC134178916 isoform X2 [Corticium candelabrum]